jgi:hypothetical protein
MRAYVVSENATRADKGLPSARRTQQLDRHILGLQDSIFNVTVTL